jgi:hypothetical protein
MIFEFEWQFSSQELMDAIDIFYFQYWLNLHAKEMFWGHLTLLNHFDFERFIGLKNSQMKILTFLDQEKLDLSTFFFKNIM